MSKVETIRHLLIGDLRRIFRHRYGVTLPDDDAGRDDLDLLLRLHSASPRAAEQKMRFEVEILAPWMPDAGASDLIDSYLRCDPRRVWLGGKELGERILFTNAEREMLKAWRIVPVDMTAEDLTEQRRAKKRDRDRARRRRAGSLPRQAYEANAKQRLKPWESERVSRATWYRRRETSPRSTIVIKADADLSHAETRGEPQGPSG